MVTETFFHKIFKAIMKPLFIERRDIFYRLPCKLFNHQKSLWGDIAMDCAFLLNAKLEEKRRKRNGKKDWESNANDSSTSNEYGARALRKTVSGLMSTFLLIGEHFTH
jgi:hypothetical protein